MAPIADLTVRVSAQIAELQKDMATATKTVTKFADEFEGAATKAAAVGSFLGSIAADIAGSMARGFGSALKDAVKFSSEFNNAFIGLGSVAKAFGSDTATATAAAKSLSKDGLLPLKDSATGLKNLLAAGFNLEQSTKLMNAFKDSAAFGRQGALSFGDAIRSATEGVKNGNSILVDNAGVTKNLSQILKEAGFSAQDLSRASSDAGVRMALFNGIIKETRAQTGDAAKLTQTYSGQVTRLESTYNTLLASVGDAITQNRDVAIAVGFVGDAVQKLTGFLSQNGRGFNLVSDAIILAAKTFSGLVTAVDVVHTALNAFDSFLNTVIFNLSNAVGSLAGFLLNIIRIGMAVPGATTVFAAYSKEITGLLAIQTAAGVSAAEMSHRVEENGRNTAAWSSALGSAKSSLNGLVTQLTDARGQTVAFGDAAGTVAPKANAAADGVDKLGKKAKAAAAEAKLFRDQIQAISSEVSAVDDKVGSFGDGFVKAVDKLKDRVNGVDLKERAQEWAEAMRDPIVAGHVLADDVLRKELGTVIADVTKKFGSLQAAGVGSLNSVAVAATELPAIISGLPSNIFGALGDSIKPVAPEIRKVTDSMGDLVRSLDAMARVAGPSFAVIVTGVANVLDALRHAGASGKGGILAPLFDAEATAAEKWSAKIQAGVAIAGGAMAVWSSTAQDASKSAGAFHGAMSGAQAGAVFGPYGAAVGAAAGAIAGMIRTLSAGRRAVEDFAKSFDTVAAGTGFDELRQKMLVLGDEGERLWKKLTQQTGRGDKAAAAMVIDEIQKALLTAHDTDPSVMASGLGFKTQKELQAIADTANTVYTYMRDSGLYTASAIADAFQKSKDAQIAALDDVGSANSKRLSELGAEFDSLNKSIANEAPEEVMGVVERQTRDRIAQVQAEQAVVQKAIEDSVSAMSKAAHEAAADITSAFKDINIPPIQVEYEYKQKGGSIPGSVPALAKGGIVRQPTLALVGERGPEAVVPLSQMGKVSGGGDINVTLVMPDGEVLLRQVVKAKQRLGL